MSWLDDWYPATRQATQDQELDQWVDAQTVPLAEVAAPGAQAPTGEQGAEVFLSIGGTPLPGSPTGAERPTPGAPAQPSAPTLGEAPPAQPSMGIGGVLRSIGRDIATGVGEAGTQIAGGARDAVVNTLSGIGSLADWWNANSEVMQSLRAEEEARGAIVLQEPSMRGLAGAPIPPVAAPESVTGGLIRSASQFLTAFVPAYMATGGLAAVGPFVQGAVAGAIADFSAFDPQQPRVSNLLQSLAPEARIPIISYLAASPDDTEAEGRLKNAIEGLSLGIVAEGLILAARLMKRSKTAQQLIEPLRGEAGAIKVPGGGEPQQINLAGMASAMGEGLINSLWSKVQAGEMLEAGQPSAILQAAKLVRGPGRLQTRDEFATFAREVQGIKDSTAGNPSLFQSRMQELVQRSSGREPPRPPGTPRPLRPEEQGWLDEIAQATDVQRARELIATGTPTRQSHLLPDGTYTPERQALQQQIVEQFINPRAAVAEDERPIVAILLGPPAAGKSRVLRGSIPDLDRYSIVDSDAVKAHLPEYQPAAAELVHQESADIAEGVLLDRLVDLRHNIVLDITGKNANKVEEVIRDLAEEGYRVHVYHITIPSLETAKRAITRFRDDGRFVDPEYILREMGSRPDETYARIRMDPNTERWVSYDNDVPQGSPPRLRERGDRPPERAPERPSAPARPGRVRGKRARADDAEAPTPETPAGRVSPPAPPLPPPKPPDIFARAFESPGRFNPARQALSAKLRTLTSDINVRARELGLMEEQTRGTIAMAETSAAARALVRSGEMSAERILSFQPGTILTAEEGTAARFIRDAAMDGYDKLMRAAEAGDEAARGQLASATYLVSQLEAKVEAASGTEVARALGARRIISRPSQGLPKGTRLSQTMEMLRLLQEGPLSPEAETSVQTTIAEIRRQVRRQATEATGPEKAVLEGVADAVDQAAAEGLPPGQALAGIWDIILRNAAQAEEGLPPPGTLELWQRLMQDVQDQIINAVPEGHLLGGLWENLLQGVARADATMDPNLLMGFWQQLVSGHEKETYLRYLAETPRYERLVNAFLEARQAGLLGVKSLLRNVIGSGMTTLWAVPERELTAIWGTILRTPEGAYAHEGIDLLHGFWHAQKDALKFTGKALTTGEAQVLPEALKTEARGLPAISGQALGVTGPMGHAIDVAGEIIRWKFRGLAAGDDYFKWVNREGEVYALAYRDYRQAIARGLPEKDAMDAYMEALKHPPAWIEQAADEMALYRTFNDEILNPAGKLAMDLRNMDHPAGWVARFLVPYAKTPMNVMGYAAEQTPGLNLLSTHFWQELRAGGVRRDAALARLSLGSAALTVLTGYAMQGYLTGKGPRDPNLRAVYRENGWQAYSLRKPGMRAVPFRGMEPLSLLAGLSGDFAELVQRGASFPDLLQIATASVLSITEYMGEQPMLQGLSDLAEFFDDPEMSESLLLKQLASIFPFPGFQGEARLAIELTDPYLRELRGPHGGVPVLLREVEKLTEAILDRIPMKSDDLYPMRDRLGRPMLRSGGLWPFSPQAPSGQLPHPVFTELERLGLPIGKPPKSFGTGKLPRTPLDPSELEHSPVELSAAEWDRFQVLTGQLVKEEIDPAHPASGRRVNLEEYLTNLIALPAISPVQKEYQAMSDGPHGGKADEIRRAFQVYRRAAKEQLLEESERGPRPPGERSLKHLVEDKKAIAEFQKLPTAEQTRARPRLEERLGQKLGVGR